MGRGRLFGIAAVLAGGSLLAAGAAVGSQPAAVPAIVTASDAAALPDPGLRLISQSQYINTINSLFGADIPVRIRFAPVKRINGLLAVGASTAVVTSGALDPLDATGRAIAMQVVDREHRDYLIPCKPADPAKADEACARTFLGKTGRLLFRRPLREEELAKYVSVASGAVAKGTDFYTGLGHALAGMLVSPQFLYIRETAEPDPANPAVWRLDGYSKAARLARVLWNSAPDDALMNAAAAGALHNPQGLKREVDRMIGSPLYRDGVREFFNDFLVLETFDNLTKDPTIYPAFSLRAVTDSREQILRTVTDHLIDRHGDYRDLFTTRHTMMSGELATIYRVPVNTGSLGWVPYEFPQDDPRAGLLTQVGFLAQYAHAGRSSPTRRGRGIREVLLCQHVPDPPPNVDFSNFEGPKGGMRVARERLDMHSENPVCAGCHSLTDPIGLALENFDGAGQFRTKETGMAIDPSGSLDGVAFKTPAGLGQALRDNPALKSCIVNRLYAFSTGRSVMPQEETRIEQYAAVFDKRGYRFDDMLRTIVSDRSFFAVKPVQMAFAAPSKGIRHADQN
jgi:hypothetical protein